MKLVKDNNLQAGWTLGFQADGRELIVVVAKETFILPTNGSEAALAEKQIPLTQADEFTGEPGHSATRYESDYAHRKPFCDVLVNGSAYAVNGEPATKVVVRLRVGPIDKRIQVMGNRVWDKLLFLPRVTPPEPFLKLPISYDRAYGGMDKSEKNPTKIRTYVSNPVGVGYYPITNGKELIGKPLPNSCEIGHVPKRRKGNYQPKSYGPMGRNFKGRVSYAGTYDKAWLQNRAPFWPDDFDYRYFQCAPADQQMPHIRGGEEVTLENLTPDGIKRFRLPKRTMPVIFARHKGGDERLNAVCDTLIIEPDEQRFTMTWRAALALRRNCFELKEIVLGEMPRPWYRARREAIRGKRHYANLEELIQAKRRSKSDYGETGNQG